MTVHQSAPTAVVSGLASKVWVAAAMVIGTTIKWYDLLIFGTASALVFQQVVVLQRVTPSAPR